MVDSTSALPIIQYLLGSMKFDLDRRVSYDPKHIISKRKVSCKLGTFEHEEDQELLAMANSKFMDQYLDEEYIEQRKSKEVEVQLFIEQGPSIPTPYKNEASLKRPQTEET